ncbi:MAG: hypothetical protein QOK36_682, partial [Gaiellales bacterium]|nr:hypothetical protein [Gaiellales bacterium]
ETAAGRVCVCGDVIYDVQDQVVGPLYQVNEHEPMSTGNHGMSKRDEHAAIKKAINSGDFVVPIHDYPARIDRGRVVARLGTSIPGPEVAVEQLLPSATGAPVHEVDAGPDRTRSPLE